MSYFLQVDWRNGDANPPGDGGNPADGPSNAGHGATIRQPPTVGEGSNASRGVTTGTLNLRGAAYSPSRIVGLVSRGRVSKIPSNGRSPGGGLWYEIRTVDGKEDWIWSQRKRVLGRSLSGGGLLLTGGAGSLTTADSTVRTFSRSQTHLALMFLRDH